MPQNAEQIRVYLLDDHDLVRRGIRDLLAASRDILVVGESRSARGAPEMITAVGTDVMVLDLHLQDGSGVNVCRRVRAVDSRVRGLMLTAAGDDEAAIAAVLAGAAGFTTKYAGSVDLIGTIRSVGNGKQIMDEALKQRMVAQFLSHVRELRPAIRDDDYQILSFVTEGLTDSEVAERLGRELPELSDDISALIELTTRQHSSPLADEPQKRPRIGRHRAEGG